MEERRGKKKQQSWRRELFWPSHSPPLFLVQKTFIAFRSWFPLLFFDWRPLNRNNGGERGEGEEESEFYISSLHFFFSIRSLRWGKRGRRRRRRQKEWCCQEEDRCFFLFLSLSHTRLDWCPLRMRRKRRRQEKEGDVCVRERKEKLYILRTYTPALKLGPLYSLQFPGAEPGGLILEWKTFAPP